MNRNIAILILALFLAGLASQAGAATEVRLVGDTRVYGVYFQNKHFTGWNAGQWTSNIPTWTAPGTRTEDTFQIWERFRVRTDYVANEVLKFRLGIKIEDTWGHGTFTAANPQAAILVYQCYMQFKFPNSAVELTLGLQNLSLPQSRVFNGSLVFNDEAAAAILSAPIVQDHFSIKIGYSRFVDTTQSFDATINQSSEEFDMFFLTLPVTFKGFGATPWAAFGVVSKDADYYTTNFAQNLLSPGSIYTSSTSGAGATPTTTPGWSNNQNLYWWAGLAAEMTALDPVNFYLDVIYGQGAMNDASRAKRHGWFVDGAIEYTGFKGVVPQAFGWTSTGEDSNTNNGSERLPIVQSDFNAGNSFLLDGGQLLGRSSNMLANPVGSWGIGLSLNKVTFIEKLTSRLTFLYMRGLNSPSAIRDMNVAIGDNPYFTMGRDLAINEQLYGLNFDHQYLIYENLTAVMETGFAHGDFNGSVWGRRFLKASQNGDAWKMALGLTYKF